MPPIASNDMPPNSLIILDFIEKSPVQSSKMDGWRGQSRDMPLRP
jgi:hypothetical protein